MRQILIVLGLISLLLLAACGTPTAPGATPEAPTAAVGEPTAVGAYPAPGSEPTAAGAYPGPAATDAAIDNSPLVVPQPASAQVGVVHGALLRINTDSSQSPIAGGILYLGVILDVDGRPGLVELDKRVAPFTLTNGRGEFAFSDVPPGRYGLMYETPEGQVLLKNPTTGADLIIEVAGGQTVDLGPMAHALPE